LVALFRQEAIAHSTNRLMGEVILAIPLSLRIYAGLAIAVVAACILFLSRATYSRHEEVTGWLVPRGGIIRVTARSGGTVEQILVKEGDVVAAGQPIAQMRMSPTIATGKDAGDAANVALLAEARAVNDEAAAARAKLLAEQQSLGPKIRGMKEQLAQTRAQTAFQQEQVKIAQDDLRRFQAMVVDHIVAERLVGDRRSVVLSAQQNLSRLYADAAAIRQQIADARNRQEAIKSELKVSDASARVSSAQVSQKIIQNSAQSTDVAIATVGGRVQAIPVEQGQNLVTGATIAVITPKGARLDGELYAPSRAIGFVRPGQQVRLMYLAFPHEKFGAQQGRITSLSRTILSPSEVQIPGVDVKQPVFRMRVALADQGIHAYGEYVPLQPGMLLTANIVFDHRTLLQWLFDPIYAVRK